MIGTERVSETRNVEYVAWRDELASLETMKGPEWTKILKQEKENFSAAVSNPNVKVRIPAFKESLIKAKKAISQYGWFSLWYKSSRQFEPKRAINISFNGQGGSIRWAYHDGPRQMHVAEDIDIDRSTVDSLVDLKVYTINDIGDGSANYKLTCSSIGRHEIWSKNGVGPTCVVLDDRVYYLRPKKRLWYNQLCSCNKDTGRDERVEFEMKDHRYNLNLVKVKNGFFLKADNNGYSFLYYLNENKKIRQIDEDAIWHIPINYGNLGIERFVLTTAGNWEYRDAPYRIQIAPQLFETYGEPTFYDSQTRIMLTYKNGVSYCLRTRKGIDEWKKTPVEILRVGGGIITPDIYRLSTDDIYAPLTVLIESPSAAPYLLNLTDRGEERALTSMYKGADNNEFDRISVKSADGTKVYAGFVKRKRQPTRGLIVVIYGAYGSPTMIGSIMKKWGPLIESGWAIGFAYVRGGGDNGWDWAEAGRRENRYKSFEDAEACIKGLRRHLGIPAANTIIYGRSAGGIQVGALANRNPTGDLFGGIYCEVPYLDVLQTTTNPTLPLTELEYDEFGDPLHRMTDLAFWVRHSPVTNIPANGLPALMILCRTGLNDTQVYAYEPVKWILKARGPIPAAGKPKLLGIEGGQGHFYTGPTEMEARAIDLALLDSYLSETGSGE